MKVNSNYVSITLMVFVAIIATFYIYSSLSKKVLFTCSSKLSLTYPNGDKVLSNFRTFIYNDNTGLSTFRGSVINDKEIYIINRDIPFDIGDGDVKTVIYHKPFKKNNDTVPDAVIWNKMFKSGTRYYISVFKTPAGEILVEERGSLTYLCAQ